MDRHDILTSFGATSSEVAELLAYETRILQGGDRRGSEGI